MMGIKRRTNRRQRPRRKNDWLSVVGSLDKLMANRAAKKTTRREKPPIDKVTLTVLNTAYSATLRYYTRLVGGGEHYVEAEKAISRLWQKAGIRLQRYDPVLARHNWIISL